jgi:hypothetical protein
MCVIGVPEEKRDRKKIFEEIMPTCFPSLAKDINLQVQAVQTEAGTIENTPRHTIVPAKEQRRKENACSSLRKAVLHTQKTVIGLLIRNDGGQRRVSSVFKGLKEQWKSACLASVRP